MSDNKVTPIAKGVVTFPVDMTKEDATMLWQMVNSGAVAASGPNARKLADFFDKAKKLAQQHEIEGA